MYRDWGSRVEGMAISTDEPKRWPDHTLEHLGVVGEAKNRSRPNRVNPMAPNGTSPISICRPDRRSHRSDPVLIPMMNRASSPDIRFSSPPSTFWL